MPDDWWIPTIHLYMHHLCTLIYVYAQDEKLIGVEIVFLFFVLFLFWILFHVSRKCFTFILVYESRNVQSNCNYNNEKYLYIIYGNNYTVIYWNYCIDVLLFWWIHE